MRIIKDAEERKNEILDMADKLFAQKGFEGTSTNDILEAVGIARGTLYYHFKSKEDIMDALIQRHSDRLLSAAEEIAGNKTRPVCERIMHSVMAMRMEQDDREIMEHIHKPQNVLMHHKVQKAILGGLTPILTGLIREGMEEGLFHTPFPYECMEMLVVYASTVFDGDMVQMTEEEGALRIEAFIFNMERLLGVESGTLSFAAQMFGNGEEEKSE